MDDNVYAIAQPPPVSIPEKTNEAAISVGLKDSQKSILVKITGIVATILLILFVTTIALHFRQQSEWKEGMICYCLLQSVGGDHID